MRTTTKRVIALITLGLLVFQTTGLVSADHDGVPGLEETDGWVDVHGDTMHGDLDVGNHQVILGKAALYGSEDGELWYGSTLVCLDEQQDCAGLVWRGAWDSQVQYEVNDAVHAAGSSWIAVQDNVFSPPGDGNPNWDVVAAAGAEGPQGEQGPEGPPGEDGSVDPIDCGPGGFIQETFADGSAVCGSAWVLAGNAGTNASTDFIGTTDAEPLVLRVDGQTALVIQPGDTPNLVGGHAANEVSDGVVGATIGGGGSSFSFNRVTDDWSTVGGGRNNRAGGTPNVPGPSATVGGGDSNRALGDASTIGGGESNTASRLQSTVGGGFSNLATGELSTVGGGESNTASRLLSTVSGGSSNAASDWGSTVGGGRSNTASHFFSTVGGGDSNTASGNRGTVGGGLWNTASATRSTVGGGESNTASGPQSTIPGGLRNEANGETSLAAGSRANADHDGAFVWRDSWGATAFHSTADNQFRVRSVGGVQFWTNTGLSAGCSLAAGGGTWSCTSDRNAKENWREVDSQDVLKRLTGVPVATWNYHSQDEDVVHMGPAAQDFHKAFGLGDDEKSISQVDSAGVAFAAIQGLNEIVEEQAQTIEDLEQRLERLETLLEE